MTNVLITGGSGFLGARLARQLLAVGSMQVAGSVLQLLSRVTLVDRVPAPPERMTGVSIRPPGYVY